MPGEPRLELLLAIESWEPLRGALRDLLDGSSEQAFSGWTGLAVALRGLARAGPADGAAPDSGGPPDAG